MKSQKFTLWSFAALALSFVMASCSSSSDPDPVLTFESGATTKTITFTHDATTAQQVNIESNVSWNTEVVGDWINITPAKTSISVTTTANTTTETRTGTITISSPKLATPIVLTVTQTGRAVATLIVTPTAHEFAPATDLEATFAVTTNQTTFTAEKAATGSEWFSFVKNASTIVVTATANTGVAREGKITITAGDKTQDITLTQAAVGTKTLTVDVPELKLTIPVAGLTKTITVSTTETAYTATLGANSDWFTITKVDKVVTLTVPANAGVERSGSIIFMAGDLVVTVNVTQTGAPLMINPGSLSFGNNTDLIKTLTVDASVTSYTVAKGNNSDAWYSFTKAGNVITVTAVANTGGARSATIKVTYGSQSKVQEIAITQAEGNPADFNVSATELNFTETAQTAREEKSITYTVTSGTVSASLAGYDANPWITITSVGTEGFKFKALPNPTTTARTATVVVRWSVGNGVRYVTINQVAGTENIAVAWDATTYTFPAAGGTKTFTATTNSALATAINWVSTHFTYTINAANNTITVTAPVNTVGDGDRYAILKVATISGFIAPNIVLTQELGRVQITKPANMNFDAAGGPNSVVVTSPVALTCTDDADWLTATVIGADFKTISLMVMPNGEVTSRTATVTLTEKDAVGAPLTTTFTVTQAGQSAYTIPQQAEVNLTANGVDLVKQVVFDSPVNIICTVDAAAALWLTPAQVGADADKTWKFTALENTGVARQAIVTVTEKSPTGTAATMYFTVKQAAAAVVIPTPADIILTASGAGLSYANSFASPVTLLCASLPADSWLTVTDALHPSERRFNFTAQENYRTARQAVVTLTEKSPAGGATALSTTFLVKQSGFTEWIAPVAVAGKTFVAAAGGTGSAGPPKNMQTFAINASGPITCISSKSWVQPFVYRAEEVSTDGIGKVYPVAIALDANGEGAVRTATITVTLTGTSVTRDFIITQEF